MKRLIAAPFIVIWLLAALVLTGCFGQGKPTKIEGLDWEIIKRTEAQLQALNLRYQSEAAPIIAEHDSKVEFYCKRAGYTTGPQGDCVINPQTGEIGKRPTPPQSK
jgi:hypothetical protein